MFHSFAESSEQQGDQRLFAPSAARNVDAICDALRSRLPETGLAFEIASGTGEHVIAFAALNPALLWQPTDLDPRRVESINAWRAQTGATNVLPALTFNAAALTFNAAYDPWPSDQPDFIFLSNLLHIVSQADCDAILKASAAALKPGGSFAAYGPFLRKEGFASEADERFDASIREERPTAGYKLVDDVETSLSRFGFEKLERVAMPSNNLILVGRK